MALLSGTPGFTLPTVIRLLAAEWEIEAGRIEEALLRDFHAGEFDPPPEALANYNAAAVEPSTDFACCWETVTEYVDLLGNKHTTPTLQTSQSILGYSPRSNSRFSYQVGDTTFDRTIIPEGAIVLFCERWKRPEPAFLKDGDFATYPGEEDVEVPLNATGTEYDFGLFSSGAANHKRTQRRALTPLTHKEILQDLLGREPRSMDRKETVKYIEDTYHINRPDARRIATDMPEEYKFGRGERRSLLANRRS